MNRLTRASGRRHCLMVPVLLTICTHAVAAGDRNEVLDQAIDKTIEKIAADLGGTSFPEVKNVAVVPLRDDLDGYATSSLESRVTRSNYALFTRKDEVWNKLLAEIEWGVRREDIMNPETVQKFGKIEGVDAILYGRIWDTDFNLGDARGRVKISVHLADVETGQMLWSSGPVESEAYMHWSDATTTFWRYPVMGLGALVALVVVLIIVAKIKRMFRPL